VRFAEFAPLYVQQLAISLHGGYSEANHANEKKKIARKFALQTSEYAQVLRLKILHLNHQIHGPETLDTKIKRFNTAQDLMHARAHTNSDQMAEKKVCNAGTMVDRPHNH